MSIFDQFRFCFVFLGLPQIVPNRYRGLLKTPVSIFFNSWLIILINTKNCSLSIVLTATDQKPQKSLKR